MLGNHCDWVKAAYRVKARRAPGNMPKGVGQLLLSLTSLFPTVQSDSDAESDFSGAPEMRVGMGTSAARPVLHPQPPPLLRSGVVGGGIRVVGAGRRDKSVLPGASSSGGGVGASSTPAPSHAPAPSTWSSSCSCSGGASSSSCCGRSIATSSGGGGERCSAVDDEGEAYDDYLFEADFEDGFDEDDVAPSTSSSTSHRRGELWRASDVYPAGISSLLDEDNLHAARGYDCPCGEQCLARVTFIELYEHRKEAVRCVERTHPGGRASERGCAHSFHYLFTSPHFKCAHVRFNVCLCMCDRLGQGKAQRLAKAAQERYSTATKTFAGFTLGSRSDCCFAAFALASGCSTSTAVHARASVTKP